MLSRVQLFATSWTTAFCHGISQARILEWVAISFSRGSSRPRDQTPVSCVSCIGRWILYHCITWEANTVRPNRLPYPGVAPTLNWTLVTPMHLLSAWTTSACIPKLCMLYGLACSHEWYVMPNVFFCDFLHSVLHLIQPRWFMWLKLCSLSPYEPALFTSPPLKGIFTTGMSVTFTTTVCI